MERWSCCHTVLRSFSSHLSLSLSERTSFQRVAKSEDGEVTSASEKPTAVSFYSIFFCARLLKFCFWNESCYQRTLSKRLSQVSLRPSKNLNASTINIKSRLSYFMCLKRGVLVKALSETVKKKKKPLLSGCYGKDVKNGAWVKKRSRLNKLWICSCIIRTQWRVTFLLQVL